MTVPANHLLSCERLMALSKELRDALMEQVLANRLLMKDAGFDDRAISDSTAQARNALRSYRALEKIRQVPGVSIDG